MNEINFVDGVAHLQESRSRTERFPSLCTQTVHSRHLSQATFVGNLGT
jgi:hypothetical protein